MDRSFKFLDKQLNRQFHKLLGKNQIQHSVDDTGTAYYSSEDEMEVENKLIPSIRKGEFSLWQFVTCPEECIQSYKNYMRNRSIRYKEVMIDGRLWFLMDRDRCPHAWKLK